MHKTRWYPQNQQEDSSVPSKPTKTKKFSLDKILDRRYSSILKQMQASSAEEIIPPADERDFEARITKYEEDIKSKLFGFMYYLKESKTLKRDSSVETIFENKNVINMVKLRFTIQCLTQALKLLKCSKKSILESSLIGLYQSPLKFYVVDYVNDWIAEAFEKNGHIFDS